MTTISTVDQIRSIDGKVYVRWSRSVKLDQKRGYSLRYGSQAEAGLSCCEIDKTWADWRIIRQLTEYQFCGGSCWIITGDEAGRGGDNEPLLINVTVIGKVSSNLLATDWQAMEKEADIAWHRQKLTVLTNPIAIKIFEADLARLLAS